MIRVLGQLISDYYEIKLNHGSLDCKPSTSISTSAAAAVVNYE